MSNDPVETFRLEANDLLEQLEQGLLDLGQNPESSELVDQVFRALHTIKGSGAMFGFTAVADFVHKFETAFDRVRKGAASVSPDLISVCLTAKDHIAGLITAPEQVRDGSSLVERLEAIVADDSVSSQQNPAQGGQLASPAEAAVAQQWKIQFYLPQMH